MVNSDRIIEFKRFFESHIDSEKESIEMASKEREAFLHEFPLARLAELSEKEYCLGTDQSKDSLCYLIEFGKYKHTGFGIGGGSAKKYGVYYSKSEQCYKHGSDSVKDIKEFWPKFREEMFKFLVESGEAEQPLSLDDYPMLQGMAMVLTKLLCLYFPEKYFSIGSYSVIKDLMDQFNYDFDSSMRCHQLNFYFNRNIRADIPEFEQVNDLYLGRIAWIYIDGKPSTQKKPEEIGLGDDDIEEKRYWIYSPGDGAAIWEECYESGIMAIGWDPIGDLRAFNSKDEMKQAMKEKIDPSKPYKNAAHATWQFVKEMKPGDIVFAKKGMHLVIGRGVVESDYEFDSSRKHYKNIRKVKWTHKGEWPHPGQAVMKTLTDITAYTDYVEKLNAMFVSDAIDDEEESVVEHPVYAKENFLEDVYMDENSYETLVALIRNKKNVILQGAPGVGKTFAAKRLAYSMMGIKDPDRVMMVQFHQSYSYEDFIMGFRPSETGFELKHGAFYSFCKQAEIDSENEYFFIIDEINRGNLSKIFGELFMLIETDKRGVELQLLYSDEKFSVPGNVYIIGMMNTADRSLAMLDYALRRRFAFFEMKPGFDTDGFREYRMGLASEKFDRLINSIDSLNVAIAADDSLGEGFCIGHSYFCNLKKVTDQALSGIVEYELIPLLKEYWFDEPTKVKDWANILRSAIK